MTAADWPSVEAIYLAGIESGDATFEIAPPTWRRFRADKLPAHRFVAVDDTGSVVGWVAAAAVSDRSVYRGVVEHSIYVHPAAAGRGVGRLLLETLIDSTEAAGR